MWLSQGRNRNPCVWRSRALITFLAPWICCKNRGSESSPWRQVRDVSMCDACHHPFSPVIVDGIGDHASRGDALKEDGHYPAMAVEQRMQPSAGRLTTGVRTQAPGAAAHHFRALSPSAWLLRAAENEDLNGGITTSATSPHKTHNP